MFEKLLGWFKKKSPKFELCESNLGNWYYHIRQEGSKEALCGSEAIMNCHGSMANWRHRGFLNERYCESCEGIYHKALSKVKLPPEMTERRFPLVPPLIEADKDGEQ